MALPSRIRFHQEADGATVRQGKLLSLASTEWEGEVYLSDIYISAAQFLAVKHLQEKSGAVLPGLPALLDACDFEMSFQQLETSYSQAEAVRALVEATIKPEIDGGTSTIFHDGMTLGSHVNNTSFRQRQLYHIEETEDVKDWQHPFAVLGAMYSSQTIPLSIVGSAAYELPLVSGTSTSTALDGSPLFARTIPTNAGDAYAAILYYKNLGVTHLACFFLQDAYGQAYHADLKRNANTAGITLVSFPYLHEEDDERSALEQLKASQIKHVFAIVYKWETTLAVAYDVGVIGNPEYSWILAETVEITADDFALNRTTTEDDFMNKAYDDEQGMPIEIKWAHALNGIGQLTAHIDEHPRFMAALKAFASDNSTLRLEFIGTYHHSELWQDLEWTMPEWSVWQAFNYDAALAFGIAACQTPGLFTGSELYETLLNVSFEGVTGNVSFDGITGTRTAGSVSYRIDNVILDLEQSNDEYIRFESKLAVLISNGQVQQVNEFVYYDNTTNPPPALPPLQDYDYNLMPVGVQAFGWFLGGVVMMMSVGWMVWIYLHRTSLIVKASQPVFLAQLCAGTFVMASAIIPMGLQGTNATKGLDVACMIIPWLVFIGFVIALSALLAKSWRLNKLMRAGMQMRRIQVNVVDVMWPFAVLMTTNVALLFAWTLVAPLTYARIQDSDNVDRFGRSAESYGTCISQSDNDVNVLAFQIPLLLVNFAALVIATYQSYRGRNLPTEFSESSQLAMSMASLLESLLLGAPILFVVKDDPTASFAVSSSLLSIACLCILLPVFVPKFQNRNIVNITASVRPRASNPRAPVAGRSGHDFRPASSLHSDGTRSGQGVGPGWTSLQSSEEHWEDNCKTWGLMRLTRTDSKISGRRSGASTSGARSSHLGRRSKGRNASTLRSCENIPEENEVHTSR
jgi:ABC-type branched-subunit amino acid transport system substrate-binding protein